MATMNITVLGTGIMGSGMSRSLLRAGHDVRVWNRTSAKAETLAADGATVHTSAGDAVRGADVVLTLLYDADAVVAVAGEVAEDLGANIWVQSSTIGLDGTRRVAQLAEERQLAVLDAPVLGTREPAEQGRLVPIVSGDPQVVERVRPVFEAIGSKTVVAGTELGQATALKLACNAWIASLTSALGQSLAMTDRLGLDPELFLEAIGGGAVDVPYAHVKSRLMLTGEYPTSFALDGALKDIDLIRNAAHEAGVPDDLIAASQRLFGLAGSMGHGTDDMAAVYAAFNPPAR